MHVRADLREARNLPTSLSTDPSKLRKSQPALTEMTDLHQQWRAARALSEEHLHLLEGSDSSLVHVSTPFILLTTVPLLMLSTVSYSMDLKLESPIVVGCIRTFFQLSILGLILRPVFEIGTHKWWIVVLYVLLMIIVTSRESYLRSKYLFPGMFWVILTSLFLNVAFVSLFTFGIIIRPHPVWEPQYVIPIVGMLLGNSINGVSLSLNTMLTSLVENAKEVELLLSFGATSNEASRQIMRESVRTGSMPMLNSMAVIGIIYIPGMMTGQILGGSPVMEAARYQMLIIYLISMCTFGTILTEVFLVLRVGFDYSKDMLRTDRFVKRKERPSFLESMAGLGRSLLTIMRIRNGKRDSYRCISSTSRESEPFHTVGGAGDPENTISYVAPKGELKIQSMPTSGNDLSLSHVTSPKQLEIHKVACLIPYDEHTKENQSPRHRVLFEQISFTVQPGQISLVTGPSGVGKTQLLRIIAGLSPMNDGGDVYLSGKSCTGHKGMALWRRQVRYVTQYKVDIPGTPLEFITRVSALSSWQLKHKDGNNEEQNSTQHLQKDLPQTPEPPLRKEMVAVSKELVQSWGLETTCLEKEWTTLSGGEAQRVIVAIALASRPQVLLMDESTSALDLDTKVQVEETVEKFATKYGISVLWITHDQDQVKRMG